MGKKQIGALFPPSVMSLLKQLTVSIMDLSIQYPRARGMDFGRDSQPKGVAFDKRNKRESIVNLWHYLSLSIELVIPQGGSTNKH